MAAAGPASSFGVPSTEDEKLARARRRVEALKGFYVHLIVFVLVMLGLVVVNALTGGPWWVIWVFLGWGIGVVFNAWDVFSPPPGPERVAAEMERLRHR